MKTLVFWEHFVFKNHSNQYRRQATVNVISKVTYKVTTIRGFDNKNGLSKSVALHSIQHNGVNKFYYNYRVCTPLNSA